MWGMMVVASRLLSWVVVVVALGLPHGRCGGPLLCADRLYLRASEKAAGIGGSVALAAPDEQASEQRLAAVNDLESETLPAGPRVHVLCNAFSGLYSLDLGPVDGGSAFALSHAR